MMTINKRYYSIYKNVVGKQCNRHVANIIFLCKLTKVLLLFICFKLVMKLMKFRLFYNLFKFYKKSFQYDKNLKLTKR